MIRKLVKGKTDNIFIQLFRHTFAGGIAFLVDFSLLYCLTEYLNVHYLISSLISFFVGLIITYVSSILWVFNERSTNDRRIELIIFGTIGLVGLGLTSLFMWLFTSVLSQHYLFSKILTTVIVFIWNFIAKKRILFTKKINT